MRLHAGIEEPDLERVIGDNAVLPDELAKPLSGDDTLAVGIDIRRRVACWRVRQSCAPRAATRTFPAMITISFGLGLNRLRLHRGENGIALGQAQPHGRGGNHICRPVAGDHFASLNAPGCFRQLQPNPPLHTISPVNLDQNSIAPPPLRWSQGVICDASNSLASSVRCSFPDLLST